MCYKAWIQNLAFELWKLIVDMIWSFFNCVPFPGLLWIRFCLTFSWYLVRLPQVNLAVVTDDRILERRRKSTHRSITHYFHPASKGWQHFWSKKIPSLSRDSNLACLDWIPLLNHLHRYNCPTLVEAWNLICKVVYENFRWRFNLAIYQLQQARSFWIPTRGSNFMKRVLQIKMR